MAGPILTDDQINELSENFDTIDRDGNGFLDIKELKAAFDLVGLKIPQWEVRLLIDKMNSKKNTVNDGRISFEQFQQLCSDLKSKDVATSWSSKITRRENLDKLPGISVKSSEGTTHNVRHEEQFAFSNWINSNLSTDVDLKHLLPLDDEGKELYDKVKDGILLCKMINHSCPDTIDERAINKKNLTLFMKHENLTLALNSAQSIGCNTVNIDAHNLSNGTPHLVLGLLWQIIRIGLFNQITLEQCPGLVRLLDPHEEMADLNKLSPEQILLRWVNYHLEKAGMSRRVTNFTNDIKDSEVYVHLLKQIAPKGVFISQEALNEHDPLKRASKMLDEAEKLDCRAFITANDVVEGVYKLNLAFVANLFNNHPGLDKPDEPLELDNIEETPEEKQYRNWMNSLGVQPYVNWLYSDLADGLVILQLEDIIKPGIVNWDRVHKTFSRLKVLMERLENCNYAVDLGKQMGYSLVGIAGQDIVEGSTLTLGLIWQLMRAYTLSILTKLAAADGKPISDRDIIEWLNKKLESAGKQSFIKSFQDSSISTSMSVIDLVDAIKPGSINYNQVLECKSDEDRLANAKYAVSMARKIGAGIYALPEDIVHVKPKMVMTVFACLMARDYKSDS